MEYGNAYKPRGQLAKSGSSADPAFAWVGRAGYRQTGAGFAADAEMKSWARPFPFAPARASLRGAMA